jgi:hypothetical protein
VKSSLTYDPGVLQLTLGRFLGSLRTYVATRPNIFCLKLSILDYDSDMTFCLLCGKLLEERTHDTAIGVSGVNVTLKVWEQHKDDTTSTLSARQLEKRPMLATTTSIIIKQEDEENVRDGLGRSEDETMSSSSRQPPVHLKLATISKSTVYQLARMVRCYALYRAHSSYKREQSSRHRTFGDTLQWQCRKCEGFILQQDHGQQVR